MIRRPNRSPAAVRTPTRTAAQLIQMFAPYAKKTFDEAVANKKRKRSKSPGPAPKGEKVLVGSSRAVVVKKKLKTGSKKKVVKVSKALRQKINKVVEGGKVRGTYQAVMYGSLQLPTANQQRPQVLGDPLTNAGVYSSFSALEFLHCASVLWTGKADSAALRTVTTNSIGVTDITGTDVNLPSGSVSSRACTAKFTVIDSFEKYYMKNMSDRTVEIEMYICTPKKPMYENQISTATNGVAVSASPSASSNFFEQWTNGCHASNKAGKNLNNIAPQQLYTTPNMYAGFTSVFSTEKIYIKLEPGQDYVYKLQGPKNLDLDFSKFYDPPYSSTEAVIVSVRKFSRCIGFNVKQDLVAQGTSAAATSGRYAIGTDSSPNVVSVERVLNCSLSCPESVGMRVDGVALAANANVQLQNTNKRPVFFHTTYTTAGVGAIRRVDEQNANTEIL